MKQKQSIIHKIEKKQDKREFNKMAKTIEDSFFEVQESLEVKSEDCSNDSCVKGSPVRYFL